MCKVISISNQKGGTAKSTTAVNLGIGIAREGKRVLLLDCDPQGSMTISLGFPEPDDMEVTLSTLMMRVVNEEELHIEDAILHHEEGVDLIPSNISKGLKSMRLRSNEVSRTTDDTSTCLAST